MTARQSLDDGGGVVMANKILCRRVESRRAHANRITFPAPPLKFRTLGFPQYGFKREFSGDLHLYKGLYAVTVSISPSYSPVWTFQRRFLVATIPSRGPWLSCGLCCPAGSSLTMTSSDPLSSSCLLIFFVRQALFMNMRGSPLYCMHLGHRAISRTPAN